MHSLGKTVNELHAMLKLHEQTLPKNNASALHAIRAGKVQKGNNKHKKQQPQLAARGPNQGKGKNKLAYAPKPRTLEEELSSGLRAGRKLMLGALSLYVGNSQRETVEAIGFFIYVSRVD
ncbi:hypothetical protein Tco_1159191 [Tanacetum coccineum]